MTTSAGSTDALTVPTTSAQMAAPSSSSGGSGSIRRRFLRSRRAVGGLLVMLVFLLTALAAPAIAPANPQILNPRVKLVPPLSTSAVGSFHVLGTDTVGRDILSRIFYGGRVSLGIALSAVLVGGTVGILVGLLGGYYGGALDTVSMRLVDLQLSIPSILLAVGIVALVGRSLTVLVVVIALTTWVVFARTVRGATLSLRHAVYVEAARASGASDRRILFRQILPNTWTPIIVIASQQVALAIVLESSLSFIGAGAPAAFPSWGTMVSDGRDYILTGAWWLVTFPGLAISLTVMASNFLGDGLRDVLDPRLRL